MADLDNKIEVIKLLRAANPNFGLVDCKNFVESVQKWSKDSNSATYNNLAYYSLRINYFLSVGKISYVGGEFFVSETYKIPVENEVVTVPAEILSSMFSCSKEDNESFTFECHHPLRRDDLNNL